MALVSLSGIARASSTQLHAIPMSMIKYSSSRTDWQKISVFRSGRVHEYARAAISDFQQTKLE